MARFGGVSGEILRQYIERIEKLEEEKRGIMDDIKDVYAEAKGNGFDTKIMRKIISLRKKDASERDEEDAILTLYLHALGMLPNDDAEVAEEEEEMEEDSEEEVSEDEEEETEDEYEEEVA